MKIAQTTGIRWPKNIEDYRRNLNLLKINLDVPEEKFKFNETRKLYNYFFNGERRNFTRSLLAKWEVLKNNPIENESEFISNLNKLNELNDLQKLRQKIIEEKKALYPKTSIVRLILAENGRVVFDKVTPKLKGFQKLLLKMKISMIV